MALINHTPETLCSAALIRIGEESISSILANNDRARTANALYFQAKQWLLSIHPWQFNLVQGVQLTRLTVAPVTRWKYRFKLPADRLSDDLRAVYTEAADGARPIINGFAIQDGHLLSDETALWADYSQDKDESLWPPYFAEAIITLLEAQFAKPVTDQQNTVDAARKMLLGTPQQPGILAMAMTADARPGEVRNVADAPFITSRFAGSGQWLS